MKNKRLLMVIAATAIAAQATTVGFAQKPILTIDGQTVDAEIMVADNIKMLPLRAMAETMGYEVSWDAEQGVATLLKEKDELFVKPDAARSAEFMAKIYNDRTYVHPDFVKVSMNLDYTEDENGNINIISSNSEEASLIRKVTVNSIEEGSISVNDEQVGEVILMISEETKITKAGAQIKLSDITKEDVLMVEYSPAMTMSLPPQTTAVSIEVLTDESDIAEENVTYEGKISEITEDGMVVVKAENDPYGVALKVTENTQISHSVNKRIYKTEDLEAGLTVTAVHSNMMTRSLPPQAEAISIVIK